MLNKNNVLNAFDSKGINWTEVNSENEDILILGKRSFKEVRKIQNNLVEKRIKDKINNTFIFTEHPPTLSLGNRIADSDFQNSFFDQWTELGVEVVKTNRGGEITFHAPGQLIIYPVVKIKSVKSFIKNYLEVISGTLKEFNIEANCRLNPAGLWVEGSNIKSNKIASVGLKINKNVTNHGFSLNLNCSTEPFIEFDVCGDKNTTVTSVKELDNNCKSLEILVNKLCENTLKFGSV